MKLFTVKLSDEHRSALEHYRRKYGCRSEADAIRHWLGGVQADVLPREGDVRLARMAGAID